MQSSVSSRSKKATQGSELAIIKKYSAVDGSRQI